MNQTITLYSFGDADRSGKVRWTAREIGLEVEEVRLEVGAQGEPGYVDLNPYAQIPTVELDGEILIESTAICLVLAERFPEAGLIPEEPAGRAAFWQSVALATTTLEQPTVEYALSKWGVLDGAWAALRERPLQKRLQTFAAAMPAEGYLHGTFSLADIFAAYILRIGIQVGLVECRDNLDAYVARLRRRPAAGAARFFDMLED